MALLNAGQQLVAFAGNNVKVVVRTLAPRLLAFAFELHPVPLDLILVHGDLLK